MNKLIESHNDLSGLIEIVNSHFDIEKEMFEIGMFLKISDLFDLSDNQTLEIAKLVREHYGRGCIEPNLKQHLIDHGLEADNDFEYIKMPFDIHPRDQSDLNCGRGPISGCL